jgi:hypothetical protein
LVSRHWQKKQGQDKAARCSTHAATAAGTTAAAAPAVPQP